ncbi:MAG: biotin--[acetyl-CoA-carboxylase] ligase [Verrucomicrobiota bacterium]
MNSSEKQGDDSTLPVMWENWKVVTLTETSSTNEAARDYDAWTAVVAEKQTVGRGRHGRAWASGPGGLWCSLVLPTPGKPEQWEALPLAVGLSVIRTLAAMDVDARMRWPNDIMVNDRKLAGLLLERYAPDCVVAGIGINLTNSPAEEDPGLESIAIRLADLTPAVPAVDDFLIRLLGRVHEVHQQVSETGIEPLITELNQMWGSLPRPVELHTPEGVIKGDFQGINTQGNLLLKRDPESDSTEFCAAHVSQLIECTPNLTD